MSGRFIAGAQPRVFRYSASASLSANAPYSEAAKRISLPTRDQAIVYDAVDDFSVKDYTLALAAQIGAPNITHVSRISKKRICFYLTTVEIAKRVVEQQNKLTVKNEKGEEQEVFALPLKSPTKKILISNVHADIPNWYLEDLLKKEYSVNMKSKIIDIRVGFQEPELSNIQSFRKHFHIDPDEEEKVPQCMKIISDDGAEFLYFTSDKLICFQCKQEGHLAKFCKEGQKNPPSDFPSIQELPGTNVNKTGATEETNIAISKLNEPTDVNTNNNLFLKPDIPHQPKRGLSTSTNSTISVNKQTEIDHTRKSRRTKRLKNNEDEVVEDKIAIASTEDIKRELSSVNALDNEMGEEYPLSIDSLTAFLKETHGVSDVHPIMIKYTKDEPGVLRMLKNVYARLRSGNLRARCKRILHKLDKSTPPRRRSSKSSMEEDSEYSDSSDQTK